MDLRESPSVTVVLQGAGNPALAMAIGRWLLTNNRLNQLGRKCAQYNARKSVCVCVSRD